MKTLSKSLLLILLAITACANVHDWRLGYFDRSQYLFRYYEQKEVEEVIKLDPKQKSFYAVFLPFMESGRKLDRYIFIKRLNETPETINMENIYFWGFASSNYEKKLSKEDPEFFRIYQDFLRHKAAYNSSGELNKNYNEFCSKHRKLLKAIYDELHHSLMKLQDEFIEKKANMRVQGTADSRRP